MKVELTVTMVCKGCRDEYGDEFDDCARIEIPLDVELFRATAAGPAALADHLHEKVEEYARHNRAWGWTTNKAGYAYCPEHAEELEEIRLERETEQREEQRAARAVKAQERRRIASEKKAEPQDKWKVTIDKDA